MRGGGTKTAIHSISPLIFVSVGGGGAVNEEEELFGEISIDVVII